MAAKRVQRDFKSFARRNIIETLVLQCIDFLFFEEMTKVEKNYSEHLKKSYHSETLRTKILDF